MCLLALLYISVYCSLVAAFCLCCLLCSLSSCSAVSGNILITAVGCAWSGRWSEHFCWSGSGSTGQAGSTTWTWIEESNLRINPQENRYIPKHPWPQLHPHCLSWKGYGYWPNNNTSGFQAQECRETLSLIKQKEIKILSFKEYPNLVLTLLPIQNFP